MEKWTTGKPPEKKGKYLVTVKSSFGRQVLLANREYHPTAHWYWRLTSGSVVSNTDVVAWQKCPEPYRG